MAIHLSSDLMGQFGQCIPGEWRLLWCQDTAFKPAGTDERAVLSKMTSENHGSFDYIKKGCRLPQWLLHHEPKAYVLVSAWREAKPCMAALAAAEQAHQPAIVVLLCECQRQVKHARRWAIGRPNVCICRSLDGIEAIIAHVTGQASLNAPGLALAGAALACPLPFLVHGLHSRGNAGVGSCSA
mmetsp:Transcript_16752/g.48975  ORF Transcript_16752/g.48975 Transcript_16752/m.48975 type:complete len:184 (-) Transcript_16752:121-672(-)